MMLFKFIAVCFLSLSGACEDSSSSSDSKDSQDYGENMFSGDSRETEPEMNVKNGNYQVNIKEPNWKTKTINIKNLCSFDIDLGFTGGYAGLAVDGQCKKHQVDDGTGRCFWSMDIPVFLESGKTVSTEMNEQEDSDVIMSGAMFGLRSPYMDDACPNGICKEFQGPSGTVTLAEFTMLSEGTVFFDVSNIHGISTPTSMGPSDLSRKTKADPYREGTAGECSWGFEPPSDYRKYLIEVKHAHGSCSEDSDCDSDEVCGASFAEREPVYGTCGNFFGFLNAHSNCIYGSTGYPFFCETHNDLYACAGIYTQSGYSHVEDGPGVCGCSDYEDLDIVSAYTCQNKNPLWEEKAYKWIHYIKKGCPTAYEFQFSDATSTFTSTMDEFDITFCPGDSEEKFFI